MTHRVISFSRRAFKGNVRIAAIEKFEIDPDIRRAATLPARVYRDPESLALQRERLFPRTWHFAGDDARLRTPGQILPWTMLPGCLDEPLLFTRDGDAIRALSNVCTHRGNILVGEPSCASNIVCRYHGRRFGLDGSFAFMPDFEQAKEFPRPADYLPKIPLGRWKQFLFAGLAPAMRFEDLIGPVRPQGVALERLVFEGVRDYEVKANWALYCDNFLEGFHITYVHPELAGTLDVEAYRTELFEYGVLQTGIAAPGEEAFPGTRVAAYYYWLFPATMLNFYPWGLSVNVVCPLAIDRTRVTFFSYVGDASKRGRGAGAGLDKVEMQDEAVVEGVQRGVRSRLYDRGRYSPTREQGVHHFHRLLARFMVE